MSILNHCFLKHFVMILMAMLLSNCSVYKAASNEGVSVSDIKKCNSKCCFLSYGMETIERHQTDDGKYVEIYRAVARKTGLNYARAAGHGVLDVVTLGLWEVAGTPVEGAISNNRGYIVAKVTYPSKESDYIENITIFDASGKKV